MAEVSTTHEPDQHRYAAYVDGALAGAAYYELRENPARVVFTHTEVDDAYEGQGVGSALVRDALDAVRGAGERRVVALCPFVRAWIERHPDYQAD